MKKVLRTLVAVMVFAMVLTALTSCDLKEILGNLINPQPPVVNCEHEWVDADCVTPKTCSKCSETEGEALGHTWADADCDTPKTCSVCSATDGEALGHTEVADEAKEATCTETGLTAGKHCSVCEEVLIEQTVLPVIAHTYLDDNDLTCEKCGYERDCGHTTKETVAGKDATCTAAGLTAGEKCSVCGEILVAQQEITALGHDLVHHDAKAPTCTEGGWDAYDTCSRCDHTTKVEKGALGHDLVHHDAQAPTCTDKGWDAYDTCSRCDHTTKVEKNALGHTWADATLEAPKTCSVCQATEGDPLLPENTLIDFTFASDADRLSQSTLMWNGQTNGGATYAIIDRANEANAKIYGYEWFNTDAKKNAFKSFEGSVLEVVSRTGKMDGAKVTFDTAYSFDGKASLNVSFFSNTANGGYVFYVEDSNGKSYAWRIATTDYSVYTWKTVSIDIATLETAGLVDIKAISFAYACGSGNDSYLYVKPLTFTAE